MPIAFDRPGLEQSHARLANYARALLDRCGEYALQIHADEVGPEHLLSTLMEDEACAAHAVTVHAFADPATIAEEARAMSAGILIGGSSAALAFSPHGVRGLKAARSLAVERGDSAVEVVHLLLGSFSALPDDVRAALDAGGWSPQGLEALITRAAAPGVTESGSLFRSFSDDAKRVLSAAAKLARSATSPSVSAAHLFVAGLQSETRLERAACIPASRARLVLRGRSDDPSRVEGPPLPVDDALAAFLRTLPERADSLAMLRHYHSGATAELAQVLHRQRVTQALLERARGAFHDPD